MKHAPKLALLACAMLGAINPAFAKDSAAPSPRQASISIDMAKPGAVIEPEIYGQFAEHLGRSIYDGIWVGEGSSIPNERGYRKDVLEAVKKLKVPVLRWPGGCFADQYDWRDGVGSRASRPQRVNVMWGGVPETNAFGTHEFLDFAELIGAKAYIAGNMGSMEPMAMAQWMEYMTSPGNSSLAQQRRANGRDKPWAVPLFGVGNETWGCGGNMTAEFSAMMHRRYASFVKAPPGVPPVIRVASGSNSDDFRFTEAMMRDARDHMEALSLHYYTLPTGDWGKKGPATGFDEDGWAKTLAQAVKIDSLIKGHIAIMDKYDPQKKVALYLDEWGTWYDAAPGKDMGALYQQSTLRDAEVAALTLNIFHRHTDRIKLAAIAQMVNVLQAMILTDGDRMVLTPTYHVFEMYKVFQGATPFPLSLTTPEYQFGDTKLPMVSGTAARGKDGKLWLALVNLDPKNAARVSTGLMGKASGRILSGPAMDSHNSFDKPDTISPQHFTAGTAGKALTLILPAKALIVVAVE